jgi:hypothetical protein
MSQAFVSNGLRRVLFVLCCLGLASACAPMTVRGDAHARAADITGEWTGEVVAVEEQWAHAFEHEEAYSGEELHVTKQDGPAFSGKLSFVFTDPTTKKSKTVVLPVVGVFTGDTSFMMSSYDNLFAVCEVVGDGEIELNFMTGDKVHAAGRYLMKRKTP